MFQRMTKSKPAERGLSLVIFFCLLFLSSRSALAADKTPPRGSIQINKGDSFTILTVVDLTILASDKGSGMGKGAKMSFSNDNANWSRPEHYKTSKTWSLSAGDGSKTVYAKFCDARGNWMKSAVSDTIILDTTAPAIIIVNPPDKSLIYEDSVQVLSIAVDDNDTSVNYYQFSIDGSIRQVWSTKNTYSWDTSSSSLKKYTLKFEAKDDGGSSSKEIKVFLIKEPVSLPE